MKKDRTMEALAGNKLDGTGRTAQSQDIAVLQTRSAVLEVSRVFGAETLCDALNRLADCGWNAVILPGFFEGYPIFNSQVWADYGMRRQHPKFAKWDPFEAAFDVAWRRGLDVLLSVTPYLVQSAPRSWRKAPLLRHHPMWAAQRQPSRTRRLSEAAPAETFFCPVNPDYRRFLSDTLHVLLEDYPFHGLLVDLRHYPFYSSESGYVPWCYCGACRQATLVDLGFDPAGVDFARERSLVERWKEWQTEQMDTALAYLRVRVLKARRTMRILGLLTTDSGLADNVPRPLLHWRSWVERSLVEALVMDRYSPLPAQFETQLRADIETLPRSSLLIPMLPRKAENPQAFLTVFHREPIPGFAARFEGWDRPDFDPRNRLCFDGPARPMESDSIQSICLLFRRMKAMAPHLEEFGAFLDDLARILLRDDVAMRVDRLLVVAENIRGLYDKALAGQVDFGPKRDDALHDLDLACRLAYLAGCDLTE